MHENSLPKGDRDWDEIEETIPLMPRADGSYVKATPEYVEEQNLKAQLYNRASVIAPMACWANAELHGWHNPPASLETDLLLIHSEISEACEGLRAGKLQMSDGKGSVAEELADAVIRIFHTAAKNNIDILAAIDKKHTENTKRPFRHGNKRF